MSNGSKPPGWHEGDPDHKPEEHKPEPRQPEKQGDQPADKPA